MKCRIIIGGFLAIILGGCAAQAGGPPPIREVVAFGDSLSDCGAFGFEPTTPPARAWDQQVARRFGYDLKPNWIGDLPGLTHTGVTKSYPAESCYAQSGARIANGTVGKPPIPGTAQLDRYLAEHGQFSADQLVTVYLGTNDILDIFLDQNSTRSNASAEAIAAGQVRARQAAMQLAVLVDRILDHGAKRVAVLNLYDLGESVFNDPRLSELTKQFNSALDAALPRDSRGHPSRYPCLLRPTSCKSRGLWLQTSDGRRCLPRRKPVQPRLLHEPSPLEIAGCGPDVHPNRNGSPLPDGPRHSWRIMCLGAWMAMPGIRHPLAPSCFPRSSDLPRG